eukprot:8067906-Karenia_brevis.AAC.1
MGRMRPYVNGAPGPDVELCRGVRQGRVDSMRLFCTLMCFLLEPVLQQWHRSSFGLLLGESRVVALSYADDLVLVCNGAVQLERMMTDLIEQLASAGLSLSDKPKKNLVMRVCKAGEDCECTHGESEVLHVAGHSLTQVPSMSVLGCVISADGSTGDELDDKISKATAAFNMNRQQLCCKQVKLQRRLGLLFKLVGQ